MSGPPSKVKNVADAKVRDAALNPTLAGIVDLDTMDKERSRNHSLKYSKGALTGDTVHVHFDETPYIQDTYQIQKPTPMQGIPTQQSEQKVLQKVPSKPVIHPEFIAEKRLAQQPQASLPPQVRGQQSQQNVQVQQPQINGPNIFQQLVNQPKNQQTEIQQFRQNPSEELVLQQAKLPQNYPHIHQNVIQQQQLVQQTRQQPENINLQQAIPSNQPIQHKKSFESQTIAPLQQLPQQTKQMQSQQLLSQQQFPKLLISTNTQQAVSSSQPVAQSNFQYDHPLNVSSLQPKPKPNQYSNQQSPPHQMNSKIQAENLQLRPVLQKTPDQPSMAKQQVDVKNIMQSKSPQFQSPQASALYQQKLEQHVNDRLRENPKGSQQNIASKHSSSTNLSAMQGNQHLKKQQSVSDFSGQRQGSPVTEKKIGLTRKVLLNNCAKYNSVDLPSEPGHNPPRRAQSLRIPPLLRVMDRDPGSETPSPPSSPYASSDEDEPLRNQSSPVRIPGRMRPTEKFGSLERSSSTNLKKTFNLSPSNVIRSASYSKIIQISRQRREQDDQDQDIDPDFQDFKTRMGSSSKLRSLMSQSNRGDSLEVPGSPDGSNQKMACTPPGVPVAMQSMRRDSFDIHQVKSRSLVCLAAATAAEIAGQPLMVSHARSGSYLSGNHSGSSSMLGPDELDRYFPARKLRLFVGSWNMNGQTPPAYLADFLLPQNIEYVPDLLVIGTQECLNETKEWEARLQGTLGPSHVMFHSHSLGTLHLAVFIRRDLIWFCSAPEVDSFSTRPTATFKTKGAVAIAFILFGTSFLFVNSHLTAHQENVRDRVKDLKKINAMLSLPKVLPIKKKYHDLADNFDVAFWCGDLNFRLEQTREVVLREVKDGTSILDFDQLNYLRNEGLVFNGYTEDQIKFPPTYKYDPGTNNFDTSSKQRVPSYTDRILYKHPKALPITPLHYDSVRDVVTSDHRPVWGMWETILRPGMDVIPLSGGLFNREVYLEGLKRRSEALKPTGGGRLSVNNMCNLQ